jgi:hypothetical protein
VRAVSHTKMRTRTIAMRSVATLAWIAREVEHTRTIQIPFQSAPALQAPPRANVSQFVGAGAVAPARSARPGHNGAVSNAQVRFMPSPTSFPVAAPRPNPSIERTHNGGAQCPAPSRVVTPLCAAHVKR